ncbi:hypothetical protein ACFSAG_14315, partial [Sphingorhabdus buctiana]
RSHSRPRWHNEIGDRHETVTSPIRFEKAFGIKADTLMHMQTTYDLAQARAHADDIVVDKVLVAA